MSKAELKQQRAARPGRGRLRAGEGWGGYYAAGSKRYGDLIHTIILFGLAGVYASGQRNGVIGLEGSPEPCHLGRLTTRRCGEVYACQYRVVEPYVEDFVTNRTPSIELDIMASPDLLVPGDAVYREKLLDGDAYADDNGMTWATFNNEEFENYPEPGTYLYLKQAASPANPHLNEGIYDQGLGELQLWGRAV